jgi:AcrR family transcriptional regulator
MASKSEITKEKILDSAIELFYKKGYRGVATKEIAKKAGVSEGTVFKYYSTKKDLLYKTVMKATALFTDVSALESLKIVIEKNRDKEYEIFLREIIIDRMILIDDNYELIKTIFMEIQYHEDMGKLIKQKFLYNVNNIGIEIIEIGREKGIIPESVTDEEGLFFLVGVILPVAIKYKFIREKKDKAFEKFDKEIERVIKFFICGIGGL